MPGCNAVGAYQAPKDRHRLREYYWFCLEHVREYNRRWNYFDGLSRAEIEAYQAGAATWHRPTWRSTGQRGAGHERWRDDLGVFDGAADIDGAAEARAARDTWTPEQRRAFSVLNLDGDASAAEVKTRYKELVKLLHPDLHGGDPHMEDRLKEINQAYAVLMAKLDRPRASTAAP